MDDYVSVVVGSIFTALLALAVGLIAREVMSDGPSNPVIGNLAAGIAAGRGRPCAERHDTLAELAVEPVNRIGDQFAFPALNIVIQKKIQLPFMRRR